MENSEISVQDLNNMSIQSEEVNLTPDQHPIEEVNVEQPPIVEINVTPEQPPTSIEVPIEHNKTILDLTGNYEVIDNNYVEYNLEPKKISIVMAYLNRLEQTIFTLKTISLSLYKNKEIIIVDDASRSDQDLTYIITNYNFRIKLIKVRPDQKNWINPCVAYNIGFKNSSGEIIIVQNPEVCHVGDCITFVQNNLIKNDWLSLNCYGLGGFNDNAGLERIFNESGFNNIFDYINNRKFNIGGNTVTLDNPGGWVNHFKKFFVAYHYFAAIYKEDLENRMGGGFYEGYKDGICWDDNDFIKYLIHFGFTFKIPVFRKHLPFSIHQYHSKTDALSSEKKNEYHLRNRHVFYERMNRINSDYIIDNEVYKFMPSPLLIYSLKKKTFELHKLSIVMVYQNCKTQIIKTLDDFQLKYANKYNFEVIIVDYNSNSENKLYDILYRYTYYIRYFELSENEKALYSNSGFLFNKAIDYVSGNVVLFQRPECVHVSDCVQFISNNMGKNKFLNFSCFNAKSDEITDQLFQNGNALELLRNHDFVNKNHFIDESDPDWLFCPNKKNKNLLYCCAIHINKIKEIGGFSTNFGERYFDDFMLSIRKKLNVDVTIIPPNDFFVFFQYHPLNKKSLKIKWDEKDRALFKGKKKLYILIKKLKLMNIMNFVNEYINNIRVNSENIKHIRKQLKTDENSQNKLKLLKVFELIGPDQVLYLIEDFKKYQ